MMCWSGCSRSSAWGSKVRMVWPRLFFSLAFRSRPTIFSRHPIAPPPAPRLLMLINLLPDFLSVLNSTDRIAAYYRYFDTHRSLLGAYWHNYVLDPDGPHFQDVVRSAALADRSDLAATLERCDVAALARRTEAQC